MSNRESIDDVRARIETLVASVTAGPPPPDTRGLGASIFGLLRSALERLLRRQSAQQQLIQLETLYRIHDLSRALSGELFELRQEISRLHSETQAGQTAAQRALDTLEDRATLTESLADELTAALSGPKAAHAR